MWKFTRQLVYDNVSYVCSYVVNISYHQVFQNWKFMKNFIKRNYHFTVYKKMQTRATCNQSTSEPCMARGAECNTGSQYVCHCVVHMLQPCPLTSVYIKLQTLSLCCRPSRLTLLDTWPMFTKAVSLDLRLRKNWFWKQRYLWSKLLYVLKSGIYIPSDVFHKCLYIIVLKMFHFNKISARHF